MFPAAPLTDIMKWHLMVLAERWANLNGHKLSTIGMKVLKDPRFFVELEDRALRTDIYDRVVIWFSDNWPKSPWPSSVVRRPPRSADAPKPQEPKRGAEHGEANV